MQIVIDISDKIYGLLKYFEEALRLNEKRENEDVGTALIRAVINGTPLLEGAEILTKEAYSDLCMSAANVPDINVGDMDCIRDSTTGSSTGSTTGSSTRWKMTNEEAITELSVLWERNGSPTDGRYREALDIAIEALEERTRTHASDSSEHETHEERTAEVGHWIKHENPNLGRCMMVSYECSCCHAWLGCEYFLRRSYCPNCGAKMEVET